MAATPSLRDQATTGVIWSALHTWGTHALQVGVLLVLARLLEPRDFGLFAMAQVTIVLVEAFVDQGIPDALVQADRSDPVSWSTGFIAVLASAVAVAALLFFGAPVLAMLFDEPAAAPVIHWMAPSVVLHGIHVILYARVRSSLAFAGHAIAGIIGAACAFAAGVIAALAGWGVWALVISAYAGLAIELLLLFRATGRIPLAGFDRAAWVRLVRFGGFIVAGNLTTVLNRRSDDYFVGLVLGPEILGFYAVAYRLLELVTTVSLRAVERVAFPVFSKLQQSRQLMAEAIRTSFRFTSLVGFPAFAGLILVAEDLILVGLGPQWLSAAVPLQILALGGVALCATNVLPSAIRAAGHPHWTVGISAAKGVVLVVAFAAVARLGLPAVAWVFTAGIYAAFPLFFMAARRVAPLTVREYLAAGAPALLATLVMMTGLVATRPLLQTLAPPLRLSSEMVGGAVLYLVAIALVAPGQLRELRDRLRNVRRPRHVPH